jgi:hypothetical protein
MRSDFSYKFWTDTTGLQPLTDSLVFVMPRFIADRWLLQKALA